MPQLGNFPSEGYVQHKLNYKQPHTEDWLPFKYV